MMGILAFLQKYWKRADVVGGPLETAINGVDDMLYMSQPVPTPVNIPCRSPSRWVPTQTFALEITNYAATSVVDTISRVPGVDEASVMDASQYSMRAWLDPQRMDSLGMTANDVAAAIQSQNI